jgi:hypothetical protein
LILPHDSIPRATGKTSWILKIYCSITAISLTTVYLASFWVDTKTILMISVFLKFIPKFWGLKFSKEIMNWKWSEMFPIKKLISYASVSLALSLASMITKNLFASDVKWFLTCGPIFAGIYLAFIIGKVKNSKEN